MRVLLDNRAVVGTAVLAPPENHLLLRTVAAAPSHRSGGHGRRLIAFAEEEARRRGLEEIQVFINLTLANEIRLYRGLGLKYYWRRSRGIRAGCSCASGWRNGPVAARVPSL
jgi:ribosomal protein S18 acetylase RimI-like enzyme